MKRKKIIRTNSREVYDKFNLLYFYPEVILKNVNRKQLSKILKNINKDIVVLEAKRIGNDVIIKKKNSLNYNIYLK